MEKIREVCIHCEGLGYTNQVMKPDEDGALRVIKGEACEKCDGKGYIERYAVFTVEEAEAILAELHKIHQETGECGVYEITEDNKLGEKVSDL